MRKLRLLPWLFMCLLSLAAASDLAPAPATPRKPVTDVYHGVKVVDDYRWLEDWDDPAVQAWSDAQNSRARAFLGGLPAHAEVIDRLKSLFNAISGAYDHLQYRRGVLFALRFQPPKQQSFLVTLKSADETGSEHVVVDPNQINPAGTTTIDFYVPSLDGRRVAVSMSENGSENGSVHVYDVGTGSTLPDVIPHVNGGTAGGSLAWNADGSGFFYSRYPRPGERPEADLAFYQQVYFHKLGTPTEQDTYAIGKDFPRIAEVQLAASTNGHYLLATVANGDGGDYAHYLLGPDGRWVQLTRFEDGVKQVVFGKDEALYMTSRQAAARGKILRLPLGDPVLAHAKTVVPESEAVIESCLPTASRLYVLDLVGGPSGLRVYDLAGHAQGSLPVEPVSSIFGLVSLEGDELVLNAESYFHPPAWYRYDPASGKLDKTALAGKFPVDFSDAEVVREFATSKDGTRVPINIIRRKGTRLDGKNPLMLTGYGGFGMSQSPGFRPFARLWLDRGGVYAITNLRGGGEFGEDWHRAGRLTNKQNVFDDFAACAQYLIRAGYTSPGKLAIIGGSNGGLLMGVALTQHPEMFRAVVSSVGIYDMLRAEAITANAVYNITEYGTIKDPEQFKALYAYSPYHHVTNGTAYPAVLFLTGANDPRVNPANSRKMTARLQAASSSGLPILLRTSSTSGHGPSSLDERLAQQADVYAFLFHELGMENAVSGN